MKTLFCFAALLFSLLAVSCSSPSSNTANSNPATPTPASASSGSSDTQPQSPKAQIHPCSMFSPEDAQAITGVPMKLAPGHGAIVCMYEEASPKPGFDTARVSLMVNVENSVEKEAKEWQNTKEVRHLKPGEKNVTQLSGIGDEAWLDGNVEKGKVGLGGILVRKGKADFALQSAVLQYRSSLEKMKEIARRIAGKLE
ncbi:MAG TPA: hypothetical protein VN658_06365 [Candidatus Acidoferrales bacterium]|nr:hypothetical protein [Candidatus Acidoferrales bacterium]